MKKFSILLVLAATLALFSCKNDNGYIDKGVTFQIGIDTQTPYADVLTVSNFAYSNPNIAILVSEPFEVISGNSDEENPWCGFYTTNTYDTRLAGSEHTVLCAFKIEQNTNLEDRTAVFKFKMLRSGVVKTFTINQNQEPIAITISKPRQNLLAEEADYTVDVVSNIPCYFSLVPATASSWLTVITSNGAMGSFQFEFNVKENTSDKRTAKIVFENTDYEISDTIFVTQFKPAAALVLSSNLEDESDKTVPSSLHNAISWENTGPAYPECTSQIIELSSATGVVWETIENSDDDCVESFDLTEWIGIAGNKVKYGNDPSAKITMTVSIFNGEELVALGSGDYNPYFASGNGTSSSPFIINNYGQLNNVRSMITVNPNLSTPAAINYFYYKLGKNIDVAKAADPQAYIAGAFIGTTNFLPIGYNAASGNNNIPFIGNFDGDGKTIGNVSMTTSADGSTTTGTGIFAAVCGISPTTRTVIKNLTVSGTYSFKGRMFVGGIIGKVQEYADVINCVNRVNITMETSSATNIKCVGGVVGMVGLAGPSGTVTGVVPTHNVTQPQDNANPVNSIGNSTVQNCVNYGNITITPGYHCFAGVVGWCNGNITNCGNKGNITVTNGNRVGGVVGSMFGPVVSGCYNTGNITAPAGVGGVIGHTSRPREYGPTEPLVSNCYNTGTITYGTLSNAANTGFAGGISGNTGASAASASVYGYTNCFNYGTLTTTESTLPVGAIVGGMTNADTKIVSCYGLSGVGTTVLLGNTGGTGTVDALSEMKDAYWFTTQSNFTDGGWNFTTTWTQGTLYPHLKWED